MYSDGTLQPAADPGKVEASNTSSGRAFRVCVGLANHLLKAVLQLYADTVHELERRICQILWLKLIRPVLPELAPMASLSSEKSTPFGPLAGASGQAARKKKSWSSNTSRWSKAS